MGQERIKNKMTILSKEIIKSAVIMLIVICVVNCILNFRRVQAL